LYSFFDLAAKVAAAFGKRGGVAAKGAYIDGLSPPSCFGFYGFGPAVHRLVRASRAIRFFAHALRRIMFFVAVAEFLLPCFVCAAYFLHGVTANEAVSSLIIVLMRDGVLVTTVANNPAIFEPICNIASDNELPETARAALEALSFGYHIRLRVDSVQNSILPTFFVKDQFRLI